MQCVQYIKVDVCRQFGKRDKTAEWFQFGWRQQLLLYDCRQICMDAPWASDQLLCHRCLYHADRDWYLGIRFLGIPLANERKSHFSNVWKAGGSLKSYLTVLLCYSWKLAALCHIHTQRSSCFSKFPLRQLLEHSFFCEMHNESFMDCFFGKHAVVSLLNIVMIASLSSVSKSLLRMSNVSCLMAS